MGIEKFFNTITKSKLNIVDDKTIYHNTYNIDNSESSQDYIQDNTNKIECTDFYIDFNSIIYTVSSTVENDINYLLYDIIINELSDKSIKIKNKYNLQINNIDEFKEYFKDNYINKIVLYEIKTYIKNIINYILDPLQLEYIYISFDGIPTMGKIIEQKKRKYMNYMISEFKNTLFEKKKEEFNNEMDENRKIYNENIVVFEKTNISTYSEFMRTIYYILNDEEYKTEIKNICQKLSDIIISTTDETGEGEKKIMEDIIKRMNNKKYIIYSPDADIIILSMILENIIRDNNYECKIGMIKKNNFDDYYDNIDCSKLRERIIKYILDKLKENYCLNDNMITPLDKNRIIDDISFIFTIFGNDFIPKIESINVFNGFNIIFDTYVAFLFNNIHDTPNLYKYITELKESDIINQDKNQKKINYDNFKKYIKILSINEKKLLFESYASIYYKNFNYLSNIFNDSNHKSPYFYDRLYNYINNFNKIIKIISNNINDSDTNNIINIINKIINKDILREFVIIEGDKKEENITYETIINKIFNILKGGGIYRGNLRFTRYSTTIEDRHHQKSLKEMLHPKMNITSYDKESYKLENKLDEYKNMFNTEDKFGYIDIKSKGGYYKLYYDQNLEEGKKVFYEEYFKNNQTNTSYDIDIICREYITGILWLFDFYFNKNYRDTNINMISIYSYKFKKSPFITEILNYLNKINMHEFNIILNNVNNINSNYYIKKDMFMNKLEQYLYTTPYDKIIKTDKLNMILDRYNEILNNDTVFPKIKNIVNEVLNGESNKYIDCKRVIYLNKATIKNIDNISHNEFMKHMIGLR